MRQPWRMCQGLAVARARPYSIDMTENDAVTRIHAAIRRIEAEVNRRDAEERGLQQRHAALREEVARAIADIDAIATQDAG